MTIKADSSNSPLGIVSVIDPVSPIKLEIYYDTAIRGCGRKCACRLWPNCHYYNNSRWKELRGDEEVLWQEIHEWYENFFKYRPDMPDATYQNG